MKNETKNRFYVENYNHLFYDVIQFKNRTVYAPNEDLKYIQKYILKRIKQYYPYSANIYKTIKVHVGKKWILKMDIKDFFGSVPIKNIEKILKTLDYDCMIKMLTVNKKLPAGASTSMHIANACFKEIDEKIKDFCKLFNVNYSRYVDDLFFSSDNKNALQTIEKSVTAILKESGYKTNYSKTKYISQGRQQNILGVVVNDNKIRFSKDFKREMRAKIYNYVKLCKKANYSKTKLEKCITQKKEILGYFAYIKSIDKEFYEKLKEYYFENMYKRLLLAKTHNLLYPIIQSYPVLKNCMIQKL